MRTLPLFLTVGAVVGFSNAAAAQLPDSSLQRQAGIVARPGGQVGRGGQIARAARKQPLQQAQGGAGVNRPALERQIGQAIAKNIRRQLNLNDQQMQSLSRVNMKFDVQRRNLLREERTIRQNLKAAMADTASPDQNRISQYLDQILQEPHRRADLQAAEQKELSSFLTPLQRAQYLVIKERVTARIQQAAEAGLGGARRGVPPLEP